MTVLRYAWVLVALLVVPDLAFGKRGAPPKVEPVIFEGVRYVAPNDKGRRGYVEAWDVKTGKKLWELTVFTNRIDPKLEEDVQWVFVRKLEVREGALRVTAEDGKVYRVDLKKRTISRTVLILDSTCRISKPNASSSESSSSAALAPSHSNLLNSSRLASG